MEDMSGAPLVAGDTLRGQTQKTISDFLDETHVGDDIASAISRINEILLGMEGAGGLILHSLQNVDTMSSSVRELVEINQRSFQRIVEDLAVSAREIRRSTTRLDSFMWHADELIVSVQESEWDGAVAGLSESVDHMRSILASVEAGQGSMGQLLYNDTLYQEVVSTFSTLQRVLHHLDSRPKDFLSPLGRSQKQMMRKQKRTKRSYKNTSK